jgi:flagellar protein FlgJ
MNPLAGLATDGRSLDRLKLEASRDPKAAAKQVAGQFEALFMQQLLKSMRDAMPKSGLMDGSSTEMYTGMLDQQLAQSLSGRPGGLSDMIAKQLTRNIRGASEADAPAVDVAPGAAAPWSLKNLVAAPAGQAAPAMTASQTDFVRRVWPHAAAAQQATGVPAGYVVGQAALESGWGRQEIRMPDGRSSFNVFGIKAGGNWKGATVDVTTTEYVDGQPRKSVEKFRAYGSYAEAFKDWAELMGGQARYGQVLRASGSVEGYARGMQRAGYATDPSYGAKLERTINQTLAVKRLIV